MTRALVGTTRRLGPGLFLLSAPGPDACLGIFHHVSVWWWVGLGAALLFASAPLWPLLVLLIRVAFDDDDSSRGGAS